MQMSTETFPYPNFTVNKGACTAVSPQLFWGVSLRPISSSCHLEHPNLWLHTPSCLILRLCVYWPVTCNTSMHIHPLSMSFDTPRFQRKPMPLVLTSVTTWGIEKNPVFQAVVLFGSAQVSLGTKCLVGRAWAVDRNLLNWLQLLFLTQVQAAVV